MNKYFVSGNAEEHPVGRTNRFFDCNAIVEIKKLVVDESSFSELETAFFKYCEREYSQEIREVIIQNFILLKNE